MRTARVSLLLPLLLAVALPAGAAENISTHKAGSGFKLYDGESGAVNFRVYGYARYLNQKALDGTYTDSFGDEKPVDIRHDIQFSKITLYWYGWLINKDFRYLTYVWSANTSQGLGAQVVVAGNFGYRFSEHLTLSAGIGALPGVRSTEGNFPYWLGTDNRLIADEYFRPSYTSGIWARGDVTDRLQYILMLGNNLSQLGVDAAQLDNKLDAWSGALYWMPGTGEYGGGSFGDYEDHQEIATRFGAHFTYSTEDRQSQPGTEAPENSQIRISDGNVIFTPGLFGAGVSIIDATYHMLSLDAGVKYQGFSLDGEFYYRWVNDFNGTNIDQLSFDDLSDTGFQIQASKMVKPQVLQLYLSGSKIFGEYGDPSDVRLGANWFPWQNRSIRWGNEFIYLDQSPVGALSLPYVVGGDGLLFNSNLEVNF
ncbi:MAG TPA: hypothetical protein VFX92_09415 [Candidatus Krumholzibacteria bacterium]|nr:hypothetical protein [Candidatus Krumholzibacteria bacterium]